MNTRATPTTSPTFLVELLHPESGDIVHCDVTAYLENALEAVYLHLLTYPTTEEFRPEVSCDAEGTLVGIGFFDGKNVSQAFITVYSLENDEAEHEFEEIGRIARLPPAEMQLALTKLMN